MIAGDADTLAAYRAAIAVRGVAVAVQRVTGVAPNATIQSIPVMGVVTGLTEEAGEGYSGPGEIARGVREIIVLADDLADGGFPLPLRKNDKVVLAGSAEHLNIDDADAVTRALAGAIVCKLSGVA